MSTMLQPPKPPKKPKAKLSETEKLAKTINQALACTGMLILAIVGGFIFLIGYIAIASNGPTEQTEQAPAFLTNNERQTEPTLGFADRENMTTKHKPWPPIQAVIDQRTSGWNHINKFMLDMKANPHGDGVFVYWADDNDLDEIWLVIDETVYPINYYAATATKSLCNVSQFFDQTPDCWSAIPWERVGLNQRNLQTEAKRICYGV